MTKANVTDFSEFFLSETSALDITTPDGEQMQFNGAPVRVHVYGPSTAKYAQAKETLQKEATKRVMAAMGSKGKKQEEEDKDADIKFLCAITDSFENFPFPGGAEAIYREKRLVYINDQVSAHVNDLGNFFKGAKKD